MVAPVVADSIGGQQRQQTGVFTILSFNVNRSRLWNIGHRESALAYPSQVIDLFRVQKERLIPTPHDTTRPRCNRENGSGRPFDQAALIVNRGIADLLARADTGSEPSP